MTKAMAIGNWQNRIYKESKTVIILKRFGLNSKKLLLIYLED